MFSVLRALNCSVFIHSFIHSHILYLMLYNFIIKDINTPFLFRKQFEQFDFATQFLDELRKGGLKMSNPEQVINWGEWDLRSRDREFVSDQSKVIKITSLTTGNKNDIMQFCQSREKLEKWINVLKCKNKPLFRTVSKNKISWIWFLLIWMVYPREENWWSIFESGQPWNQQENIDNHGSSKTEIKHFYRDCIWVTPFIEKNVRFTKSLSDEECHQILNI